MEEWTLGGACSTRHKLTGTESWSKNQGKDTEKRENTPASSFLLRPLLFHHPFTLIVKL
ncbi:hypothetical protein C1H46_030442 [Malus baccata]|uniref:Uncharacterized protein n=1 Tax=Malus baccata TaxID=106549 RepID=A0A540LCI3_MALBA|nr:hypothetical protein C1H46_030442 [Malus baccata]